jgi:head-tail adaptor
VRWVLPKPLINDGSTAPKPRDTIRDAAGTDWTILDVSFGRLRQSYQCISRDLVLHADLRDRVNIVRAVITQDAAKGLIRTWTTGPYLNVPARVQPIESMSVDERGKRGFRTAYDVIVGRQMDITDEDRVQWTKNDGSSVTLQILGVRNPERIDELMVIRAEVVP